ncbi:hypothetical protein ACVXHA_03410 [Escherichia coli]
MIAIVKLVVMFGYRAVETAWPVCVLILPRITWAGFGALHFSVDPCWRRD